MKDYPDDSSGYILLSFLPYFVDSHFQFFIAGDLKLRLESICTEVVSQWACALKTELLSDFQANLIVTVEVSLSEGRGLVFNDQLIKYLLREDSKDGKLAVVRLSLSKLSGSVKPHIVGASVVLSEMTAFDYQFLRNYIVTPPGKTKLVDIILVYSKPIYIWISEILCTMNNNKDEIINKAIVKVNYIFALLFSLIIIIMILESLGKYRHVLQACQSET
jgi:hypothetical protein